MKKKRTKKYANEQVDSDLELKFLNFWKTTYPAHIPATQFYFHPTRKYRFDFAWPSKKIALEVQGYGPGHNSLKGMTQDYKKHLDALLLNWRVIFVTSMQLSKTSIQETCVGIAKLLKITPQLGYIPYARRK